MIRSDKGRNSGGGCCGGGSAEGDAHVNRQQKTEVDELQVNKLSKVIQFGAPTLLLLLFHHHTGAFPLPSLVPASLTLSPQHLRPLFYQAGSTISSEPHALDLA